MLRSQMNEQQASEVSLTAPPEIPAQQLIPQKIDLDWMPESSCAWPGAISSRTLTSLYTCPSIPASNQTYPSTATPTHTPNETQLYPTTTTSMAYDHDESESSQRMVILNATPIWDDPMTFGALSSQSLDKPAPAWALFHPAFSQPSRFADMQQSDFRDMINDPPNGTYSNTTCWQTQPSIYAWQISTKLKAPITHVDQLMFSVIHCQRHLAITSDLTGEDLLGPSFPSVHLLFNQPGPKETAPSNLTEVMARYSAVLSRRGFALIPEKLASFMCMYRFVQWQISPNYQTYQALHDWQAPRPSQLLVPHPAWMDLPPWGKFREKVIENQDVYDNLEFQNCYASNLSVNFPDDPMKALIFKDGQIMVSKELDRHLSDISNMSMKRPFADKYPEFRNVCRFDEV